MKKLVLKAVVLCTMALLLFCSGISVIDAVNSEIAVCHDGPQRDTLYY